MVATPGPQSAYAPVSAQQSTSLATSVPSRRAPIRTRTTAGWRLSVRNSSERSSTALTGRPALRASAATSASRRTNVFAPNEPPIGGATIRIRPSSIPNSPARSARVLNGVWVPAHSVSRPSSHSASAACGSIGACAAPATRKTSSTTTSAAANPAATSPWRMRKRWQAFEPGIGRTPIDTASPADSAASACTSGAPGATAASGSSTAGSSS